MFGISIGAWEERGRTVQIEIVHVIGIRVRDQYTMVTYLVLLSIKLT